MQATDVLFHARPRLMSRGEYDRLVGEGALVPAGRYAHGHPVRAFLVMEVAETSLDHDRATKGPLYAESGVPEYWIVDVGVGRIEVYTLEGRNYGPARYFDRGHRLAPAAFPNAEVHVTELFP
jgi:Uma2 family endonuclease